MSVAVDINSIFSVGLSEGRKRLIAEIISLHVSLEKLLDVLIAEKKIEVTKGNTFNAKVSALPDSQLKEIIIDFNKIRNKCAHERMDIKKTVVCVLNKCRNFVEMVKAIYPEKFSVVGDICKSPLQVAITVVFDELAKLYDCSTPREFELDGFHASGQKTLDDEIAEILD